MGHQLHPQDQVRTESRAFGQHEAIRFKQDLERQAHEILASATSAVCEAEVRSHEAEEQARREARELHVQLGGARWALSRKPR